MSERPPADDYGHGVYAIHIGSEAVVFRCERDAPVSTADPWQEITRLPVSELPALDCRGTTFENNPDGGAWLYATALDAVAGEQ